MGVEHIAALTAMAEANVRRDDASLLDRFNARRGCTRGACLWPTLMHSGRLKLLTGDGREGAAFDGPYDAIHVGAAAPELPPALVKQLAPGGSRC